MRAKRAIPIVGVLLVGIVAAAALVMFGPEVEQAPEPPPTPVVRVIGVEPQDVVVQVRSQGETQPRTQSQLVAQVGGRIAKVAPEFAAGAFFEQGATLVWLEKSDYELALQQARSQVAQARVALTQERAQAEVAREEWKQLGRGEPSPLVLRQPQLAQAEAALKAARAAAAQAQLQLERTAVKAPYAGRVRATQADVGQYVNTGAVLADIFATDYAEIRLPVTEGDLQFLPLSVGYPQGQAIQPTVELRDGDSRWRGAVVRVGGTVDQQTRLIDLYARVLDPFNRARDAHQTPLPMGLFVQAIVYGRTLNDVYVVPRAALRDSQLLVVVDGALQFRDVNVVRMRGEVAIIDRGLSAGDAVVISPMETPVAGMRVRTVPGDASDY